MTFSGTISAATLNADFDAHRSTLLAWHTAEARKYGFRVQVPHSATVTSSTVVSKRSQIYIPTRDVELLMLSAYGFGPIVGSWTATARLEDMDDANFFPSGSLSVSGSVSSPLNTLAQHETTFTDETGDRYWLLKGRRYRLSFETDSGSAVAGTAQMSLHARHQR